jgi:hypothetical protein
VTIPQSGGRRKEDAGTTERDHVVGVLSWKEAPMIFPTMAKLKFRRIFVETATFQHTKHETGVFRGRAIAATALWFCEGTILLMCTVEEFGLREESIEPPETVVHHGFTTSAAIRMAVGAQDRIIALLKTKLPSDAERSR